MDMRVAIVTNQFFPTTGGEVTYVHNLSEKLKDLVDLTVYGPKTNFSTSYKYNPFFIQNKHHLETICGTLDTYLKYFSKLTSLKINADVIHSQELFETLMFEKFYKNNARILTFHSFYHDEFRNSIISKMLPTNLLQKLTLDSAKQSADGIITLNKKHYSLFRNLKPKKPVEMIPHGVNKIPKNIALKDRENNLIFVGRLTFKKNIHNFLPDFISQNIKNKFFIVGEGELKNTIEKTAAKNNNIKVTGKVSNQKLNNLYQNSAITILPAMHESFCLSVLEAMSYGVVPVCMESEGPKTFVENGKNGFLVNSHRELIEKVKLLSNDASLLRRMRRNAYHTSTEFTWEKCAIRTYNFYKNILDDKS